MRIRPARLLVTLGDAVELPWGPGTVYLSPWMYDSVTQGTWAIAVGGSVINHVRNAYVYNSSGNDADGVEFKAYFLGGRYTLKVSYTKGSNQGISKVKVDGTTVITVDHYKAGSQDWNFVDTQIDVDIPDGVKTISLVVDGKNGSSTGYTITVSEILFYRTE